MTEYRIIGKSVPKIDDFDRVAGSTKFTGDIKLEGMLHGKVLRSPYPHAVIKSIDVTKAQSLPGGQCSRRA